MFDDPHVLDGRKVISDESVDFDDFRIWLIPKSLMIQKEFRLEVWTLKIKSTVLLPSSMVLYRGQLSTVLQFYVSERQPHLDFYSGEDMRVCHILILK